MLPEIAKTLALEGGAVDNKNDSGGATFAGLSLSYLAASKEKDADGTFHFDLNKDGVIDANDVKILTIDEVATEFTNSIYYPLNITGLHSLRVRWKIFDIAVNCGPTTAVKMFQRAIGVDDDGVIGQQTIQKANSLIISGIGECYVLNKISQQQVLYYVECVHKAAKNWDFINGWLTKRAFDLGDNL